jgi:hypothetical protein
LLLCQIDDGFGRKGLARHLLMARAADLRDLPILTEAAAKIASGAGDGKRLGAGQEMIETFLLDGIDMDGDGLSVSVRVQPSLDVLSHPAKAVFTIFDFAMMVAQIAI